MKLDLVSASNFAWRTVHNNMLTHRSIALDNLSIPPIDKLTVLPAPAGPGIDPSGDGQTTMTVTVPQDSGKRKVQSNEEAPRSKRSNRA